MLNAVKTTHCVQSNPSWSSWIAWNLDIIAVVHRLLWHAQSFTCCNPTRLHFTQQTLQAFPSSHLLSTWQGLRSNQGKCIRLSLFNYKRRYQYKHLTDRSKTSTRHTMNMIENIELMTSSKIVSFQKHTSQHSLTWSWNYCSKKGLLHPRALMHEDYQCLKVQEVPN